MLDSILVINSGSSSLKFKLFQSKSLEKRSSGIIERIGLKNSFLVIESSGKKERFDYRIGIADHEKALHEAFAKLEKQGLDVSSISVIGHRVVHGGEEFVSATKIDSRSIRKLEKYSILAPLHNPANLSGIRACFKLLPKVPNIAVFDTAYYATIPEHAYLYGIPYELYGKYKIRRYGFHGLSHRYVAGRAAEKLGKPLSKLRIVTCHLGSGASITATKHGKAVETSMGFTPLEGLTMGTRCGDVDPALSLFLMKQAKMKPEAIERMLNRESGILGISGVSSDMRDILVGAGYEVPGYRLEKKLTAGQKKRCALALKMFIYDVQRYIGQFASVMGGVDAVVFTAGIGERNATVRKMVMSGLRHMSGVKVLTIPTDEELIIAEETKKSAKASL